MRPGPARAAVHWIGGSSSCWLGARAGSAAGRVVVLLVVGVVFAVRPGVPSRLGARRGGGPDLLSPDTARDHRRLARRLTLDGRYAEALREWLRSAIATVEERGVLPPRPGRTGAATAREAGPLLPDAAEDLSAAMRAFDEVWFGDRPAHEADVQRARAAADSVTAARIATADTVSVPAVPR